MRSTAQRVPIAILWEGEYVKSDEQYKPNVIRTRDLEIARVHLVGNVVDRYDSDGGQYSSIILDDGTGQIRVKFFGEDIWMLENIEKGDLVRIIGKVREDENERFVLGEIVKKLDDPNWEILWKMEAISKFKIKELGGRDEGIPKDKEDGKKRNENNKSKSDSDIKKKEENGNKEDLGDIELEEIEV